MLRLIHKQCFISHFISHYFFLSFRYSVQNVVATRSTARTNISAWTLGPRAPITTSGIAKPASPSVSLKRNVSRNSTRSRVVAIIASISSTAHPPIINSSISSDMKSHKEVCKTSNSMISQALDMTETWAEWR